MLIRLMTIVIGTWVSSASIASQELRPATIPESFSQLHRTITEAINRGDIDAVLDHCTSNVVFTPLSGDVYQGKNQIRDFVFTVMKGPNKTVESFLTQPAVDSLAVSFLDASGVANGQTKDHYKLTNGMEFNLESRWTATLVKEGDRWLVASFHISADLFNNPVLNLAKQSLYWGAAIAGGGGLLIGLLLGWFLQRRPRINSG